LTTEKAKPRLTIALSERRPITIDPDEWPVIAEASLDYDKCDLYVRVRQHADGRVIVYSGAVHAPGHGPSVYGGFFIDEAVDMVDVQLPSVIRRAAGIIECPRLGSECIANLPAEEV
jgi:hypothetical protein